MSIVRKLSLAARAVGGRRERIRAERGGVSTKPADQPCCIGGGRPAALRRLLSGAGAAPDARHPGQPNIHPAQQPAASGASPPPPRSTPPPTRTAPTIGALPNTVPMDPLFGQSGARYDALKLNWIGSIGKALSRRARPVMTSRHADLRPIQLSFARRKRAPGCRTAGPSARCWGTPRWWAVLVRRWL